MIFSGVSWKERQELDVCEKLTSKTRWTAGLLVLRQALYPWATLPPIHYTYIIYQAFSLLSVYFHASFMILPLYKLRA